MQLKKQTKCWFSQLNGKIYFDKSMKPGKMFENTWKTPLKENSSQPSKTPWCLLNFMHCHVTEKRKNFLRFTLSNKLETISKKLLNKNYKIPSVNDFENIKKHFFFVSLFFKILM